MRNYISQIISAISSRIRSRKKIILGGLVITLLFSLAPFQFVLANVFTDVLNAIKNLPISLPTLYVAIPLYVIAGALGTLLTLLTQVMLVFIKATMAIGVTPANQAFVAIGWGASQGIVNIIFILVLVFIGIATILRLQTYQLQKTLPALLIIALLVNFSGVLVGFVVDIGNLITNVFISRAASFSALGQALQDIGTAIIDMIKAPGATIFPAAAGLIIQILVQIIYFVVATLIIFTMMLLFFVRTIMLWILAILAPIAFAAYILPATKRYWTQWLQQLIQWAIIGIPISFFLYLSSVLLQNLSSITSLNAAFPSTGLLAPLSAVITAVIGNFAVLLMLMIGIMLSMQLAPAGAQGVINMGKKAGMGATKWAGQKAWKATRDRIPEGARKAMERMATGENPTWGKGKTGLGGFLQRSAAGAAGYTRRATGGIAKSAVIGTEQADAEKAKAKASKQDVIGNMKDLRQTASVAERTAIMDAMRQKNQIKDALNPDIVGKENVLKQDEVTSIYEKAHKTRNGDLVEGLERTFVNQDWKDSSGNAVELLDAQGNRIEEKDKDGNIKLDANGNIIYKKRKVADEFANITDRMTENVEDVNDKTGKRHGRASGLDRKDMEERGYASFADKIIGEVKTADEIKALQKGWWNNDDLMNAAHKFWAGNQTSQAATVFGRDFTNRLEATKKDASWYFDLEKRKDSNGNVTYAPRNVAMPRYLAGNAAQALGIAPLENATSTTQVNEMTQLANAWAPHYSKLESQYKELQAILQDRGELEIMRRIPGTQQAQEALQQSIQARRTALKEEITTLLGQSPELRTVLARTEKFLDKNKRDRQGGQQPPTGPTSPAQPGTPPQQPIAGPTPRTQGERTLFNAIDRTFGQGKRGRGRGRSRR